MPQYDTAQICRNGHVINPATEVNPHDSQDFCSMCGAATITKCTDCGAAIRGAQLVRMMNNRVVPSGGLRARPAFCIKCGKPYPWTKASLEAALELAAEVISFTADERAEFAKSLPDLVADGPKTTVAATRFKRLMIKAGTEAAAGFRKLLVDVISETAKKTIWQ